MRRDSGGSARFRKSARRGTLVALLLGAFVLISGCAAKSKVLLTDAEMDAIGAGTEMCGLFGVDGPCVGSSFTVFDPALPPSPGLACGSLSGTSQQCMQSTLAVPLPAGSAATLIQSFSVGGSSVFQYNSAQDNGVAGLSGRVPYWMHGPGPYLVPLMPNPR
jgi:hypothetical protein